MLYHLTLINSTTLIDNQNIEGEGTALDTRLITYAATADHDDSFIRKESLGTANDESL
jgi:hypothetical protein